jgi:hypothetical protein
MKSVGVKEGTVPTRDARVSHMRVVPTTRRTTTRVSVVPLPLPPPNLSPRLYQRHQNCWCRRPRLSLDQGLLRPLASS